MYSLISWPKCTHMAHFGLKFKLKFKLNAHTLCSNLKSQPYSNCLIQEVCVCGCKSSCSGCEKSTQGSEVQNSKRRVGHL